MFTKSQADKVFFFFRALLLTLPIVYIYDVSMAGSEKWAVPLVYFMLLGYIVLTSSMADKFEDRFEMFITHKRAYTLVAFIASFFVFTSLFILSELFGLKSDGAQVFMAALLAGAFAVNAHKKFELSFIRRFIENDMLKV